MSKNLQYHRIGESNRQRTEYNLPLPFHRRTLYTFLCFLINFARRALKTLGWYFLIWIEFILVRWYSVGKSWDQTSLSDYNACIASLSITNPDWDIFGRVAFITASVIGQIRSVPWLLFVKSGPLAVFCAAQTVVSQRYRRSFSLCRQFNRNQIFHQRVYIIKRIVTHKRSRLTIQRPLNVVIMFEPFVKLVFIHYVQEVYLSYINSQ